MSLLLILVFCVGVFSVEEKNTADLGECEQQLCVLQKDLLTLKTLIATQNTQIANQNVQIERQNTKIAEQNSRISEEVVKAYELKSTVADIQVLNNEQQMRIAMLDKKECANGWVRHLDTCYLIVDNDTKSWMDARDKCKNYGGDLAIIKGESTNNFLKELSRQSKGTYIWLGASDRQTEGTWIWNKTEEPVGFSNWNRNQPDNYGKGQDCAAFHKNYNFNWDDGTCSFEANYICQSVP